jgi:hypothetical protein
MSRRLSTRYVEVDRCAASLSMGLSGCTKYVTSVYADRKSSVFTAR